MSWLSQWEERELRSLAAQELLFSSELDECVVAMVAWDARWRSLRVSVANGSERRRVGERWSTEQAPPSCRTNGTDSPHGGAAGAGRCGISGMVGMAVLGPLADSRETDRAEEGRESAGAGGDMWRAHGLLEMGETLLTGVTVSERWAGFESGVCGLCCVETLPFAVEETTSLLHGRVLKSGTGGDWGLAARVAGWGSCI